MSEDRLEEIKQFQVSGDTAWAWRWLISEVEKERTLKDAITRLGNAVVEDAREKDATIATLLEVLRKYGNHILDYSGTEGCRVGITDLEEQCRCGFREALAATERRSNG